MKIQLKLYGSSELLSTKGVLSFNLPKNSKIKNLRSSLMNLIVKKKLKNNLGSLPEVAAFSNMKDEIVSDNYRLKNKELLSIIPPIAGG
jgi:molybdopterin converting factor small subunit